MLNKVILQGRLTAVPELKTTGSGTSVLSFRVACDRSHKGQNGEREADFINCVAWRQTAEFISRYFGKGDMILLDGRLQTRDYTDRDGNRRYVTEVVIENVNFCGGKTSGSGEQRGTAAPEQSRSRRNREPGATQQAMGGYSESSYEPGEFTPGFQELAEDDGVLPF